MTSAERDASPGSTLALVLVSFVAVSVTAGLASQDHGTWRLSADVALAVAAGIGASVLARRWPTRHGPRIVLPTLLWFGAFATASLRARLTFDVADLTIGAISAAALAVALRPTRVAVIGLLAGSVAFAMLSPVLPSRGAAPGLLAFGTFLGAAALVVAGFAAKRRDLQAAMATGAVLVLDTVAHDWWSSRGYDGANPLTLPLWPATHLAIAFAAGWFTVVPDAPSDAGTAWVIRLQKRPWVTSLVCAAFLAACAGPWVSRGDIFGYRSEADGFRLAAVVLGVALLYHAGAGRRTAFERLAPLLAAGVVALVLAAGLELTTIEKYTSYSHGPPRAADLGVIAAESRSLAAFVVFAPLALGFLCELRVFREETGFAAVLRALAVTGAGAAACSVDGSLLGDVRVTIVVVSLAFHAAVASSMSSALIVVVALALGALNVTVHPHLPSAPSWMDGRPGELVPRDTLLFAGWFVGGLLVVAARRVRSMTVLPDDHPVTELSAARARAAAPVP